MATRLLTTLFAIAAGCGGSSTSAPPGGGGGQPQPRPDVSLTNGAYLPAPVPTGGENRLVRDLDADGYPDLMEPRVGIVYWNDGRGGFDGDRNATRLISENANLSPPSVRVGDLDGDGRLDVVTTPPLRVFLQTSPRTFADVTSTWVPTGERGFGAALLDADGDRDIDVLQVSSQGRISLLLNDGKKRFVDGTAGRMPPDRFESGNVFSGDIDGDGDDDGLIWNNKLSNSFPDGSIVWLQNDGAGRFRSVAVRSNLFIGTLRLIDLDADGDLDVLWSRVPWGRIPGFTEILRFQGSGFVPERLFDSSTQASVVADLDADGDLDMALYSRESVRVFENRRGQFVSDPSLWTPPAERDLRGVLHLVDLDGDADADFIGKRTYWSLARHVWISQPPTISRGLEVHVHGRDGTGTTAVLYGRLGPPVALIETPFGRWHLGSGFPTLAAIDVSGPDRAGWVRLPVDSALHGEQITMQALIDGAAPRVTNMDTSRIIQ